MSNDPKMPICLLNSETANQYKTACQISFSTDPYADCGCQKSCTQTDFDFIIETVSVGENETTVEVQAGDNKVVLFKERVDYDFTALICDIGGNLGLCLGLSVISIVQIFSSFFSKLNAPKSAFSLYDPLYQKTKRVFETNISIISTEKPCHRRNVAFLDLLKLAVNCFAACASVYLVYQRIEYYLQVPLKMVVEVEEITTVQFPKVAICGISYKLMKEKSKFATRRKTHFCEVDMWDLIDKISLDKLWEQTSMKNEIMKNTGKIAENIIGKNFLDNVTGYDVATPSGLCLEYKTGPQIYTGTSTMFSATSMRKNYDKDCNRNYRAVYMTPVESDYYVTAIEEIPTSSLVYIYFQSCKLKRLNLKNKPCVDTKSFHKCKRTCLFHTLNRLIKCGLPYMLTSDMLRPCNNSIDAKASHYAYLNLSVSLDAETDCNCIRQCEEVIYSIRIHSEPLKTDSSAFEYSAFVFAYLYNITPSYREEYAYTFIKLISDIGSVTGLLSGLSLIEAFDLVVVKLLTVFGLKKTKHV